MRSFSVLSQRFKKPIQRRDLDLRRYLTSEEERRASQLLLLLLMLAGHRNVSAPWQVEFLL